MTTDGEKVGGTTTQEPVVEQKVVEPEAQPVKPLTSDDVKAMIADEVAKAREEGYKQSQRVIHQKDLRIKDLESRPVPKQDDTDITLLETVLKSVKGSGDEAEIRVAETALSEAKRKRALESQLRYQQEIVENKQSKYKNDIAEAGLDPDDPKFDSFWDAFENAKTVTGNFEMAEKRLQRVLKTTVKQEVKPEVKAETKPDIDKLKEEIRRQVMEEAGLLHSDSGTPSAAMKKKDEGYQKFSNGEITREQAIKDYGIKFT